MLILYIYRRGVTRTVGVNMALAIHNTINTIKIIAPIIFYIILNIDLILSIFFSCFQKYNYEIIIIFLCYIRLSR